ncbi:hypothetical protein HanIR_Chr01g0012881 [Helianthus annuus]|nr:hypothetical protein HanIR_Chr01g0012881 [Helianthus annuus]
MILKTKKKKTFIPCWAATAIRLVPWIIVPSPFTHRACSVQQSALLLLVLRLLFDSGRIYKITKIVDQRIEPVCLISACSTSISDNTRTQIMLKGSYSQ